MTGYAPPQGYTLVENNGVAVNPRQKLNFLGGASDNPGLETTDVPAAAGQRYIELYVPDAFPVFGAALPLGLRTRQPVFVGDNIGLDSPLQAACMGAGGTIQLGNVTVLDAPNGAIDVDAVLYTIMSTDGLNGLVIQTNGGPYHIVAPTVIPNAEWQVLQTIGAGIAYSAITGQITSTAAKVYFVRMETIGTQLG